MNRWQLSRILIYSHDGRCFELPLEPSSVNIIVGDSNTGKSALLEIINYCMGSKDCDIADHVQKHCPWVAVQWAREGEYCLLARKMPSPGQKQGSSRFDIKTGREDGFPTDAALFHENGDGVLRRFEELLGIGQFVLHDTLEENKRSFSITLRHAVPYLFLSDDTIINKNVLLHGGSGFRLNDIKETLPYFLGILNEDILRKKVALEEARREKNRITKKLKEVARIVSEGNSRIEQFLHQALDLGILDKESFPATQQDRTASLQIVATWHSGNPASIPTSELGSLRQREDTLRSELAGLNQERKSVRQTMQDAERFRNIANQQANRLKSIELLRETDKHTECPLCHGQLSQSAEPIDRLQSALEALSRDVGEVQTDQPKMEAYLKELSERIGNKQREYRSVQDSIAALIAQDERLKKEHGLNESRARLAGMADFFLQSLGQQKTEDHSGELERLEERIKMLESEVDPEALEEAIQSVLEDIATEAGEILGSLPFDDSMRTRPLVFDHKKLQCHQRDGARTVRMPSIGSDENYLSLHLAFYLVLHRLFAENQHPVPGLIVIDQVSRPYFPKEKYEKTVELPESGDMTPEFMDEREKVRKIFDVLFKELEKVGDLQILVFEKAFFQEDERYKDAVRFAWSKPDGLVPADWPERTLT
uniref:Uncharacterized protein n=1 Tax=Candidatus Kentrum sp. FW TaxID=2126338 RepID=A0A450TRV8_9GAMM|nr:MAG: Protein of unknown function (DUF3732) [Candidatus Kentron sp. FW]